MTRFVVASRLPRLLARSLQHAGLDVVHTIYLPQGNATPDGGVKAASLEQARVVVTKDADVVRSFLLLLVARPIASRRA